MDTNPTSEILAQHGRFVHALARALLRDPHSADDVTQEVALQWLRRGTRPIENPRAWLRHAVRHLASNQRRAVERRARHETLAAPAEDPRSPDEECARAELLHRVIDAVFALDAPYRETILARYFHGLTARELARRAGEPLATVRSRERRALELLRAKLDREQASRAAWALGLARFTSLETAVALSASGLAASVAAALVLSVGAAWWYLGARDSDAIAGMTGIAAAASERDAERGTLTASTASAPASRVAVTMQAAPSSPRDADEEPGTLVGQTVDTSGRPLSGVTVRFSRDEELATVESDEEGRFRVAALPSFRSVDAERQGYRYLHATNPEEDPLQAWKPMRVTLAPVSALVVTVHDVLGRPLEGVQVAVRPLPEERVDSISAEPPLERAGGASLEAWTDGHGQASIEGVWAGVRLAIRIDVEDDEAPFDGADFTAETPSRIDERLLLDGSVGTPIVALPGVPMTLVAEWDLTRTLRGHVVNSSGASVGGCYVVLADAGQSSVGRRSSSAERTLASGCTDEEGRFEFRFRPAVLQQPVSVTLERSGPLRAIGRAENRPNTVYVTEGKSTRELTRDELDSTEPIELVFAPRGTAILRGFLEDSRGRPLAWNGHRLVAFDTGSCPLNPLTVFSPDGGFLCSGFEPGAYDLVVVTSGGLTPNGAPVFACFQGLAAGDEDVRLRLGASAPVRARVRGESLASVTVARLFPDRATILPATAATDRLVVAAPAHWLSPSSGPVDVVESAEGSWIVVNVVANGAGEVELALGDPGWYRIGVTCRRSVAVSTALMYFPPGDYVLEARPPPTTAVLRGRLVADGTREFFGLVLTDERGAPLSTGGLSEDGPLDVRRVKASGEFALRELVPGRYRLRTGSVAELEQGRCRREIALEIVPGENPPLEIEL